MTAIEIFNKLEQLIKNNQTKDLIVTTPDKEFCYKIEKIEETDKAILLVTDGETDLFNI